MPKHFLIEYCFPVERIWIQRVPSAMGLLKVSFKPMSKNHGLVFSGKENALSP